MRYLVQFLSRGDEGEIAKRDKVFDVPILSLGRGTDQTIHLRDPRTALQHATIVSRDGRYILRALSLTGVLVNDTLTRQATLKVGDRVRVGDNVLTILDPPEGFDCAMTFELDPDVAAEAAAGPKYKTRLAQAGLNPRRWAWTGLVLAILIGLLVPSLTLFSDDAAQLLRKTPLPDDHFWISGPLNNAHRDIGEDCSACHTPFRRTPDRLCMDCHEDVQQHVGHDGMSAKSESVQKRCGFCHKEHNDPSTLIRRDEIVCTDCHEYIEDIYPQTELRNVSGFVSGHPDFHITMLQPSGPDQWDTVRIALNDDALEEKSGLKFPHAEHMVPEGIKGIDGDVVMSCEDCHQPQGGGTVMRTVNMERDCQSCHLLDFEVADPDRQVPHEQTDVVVTAMAEYYSWRYLYGLEPMTGVAIETEDFRRPGKITDRGEREKLSQAAHERAMELGNELIRERTCVDCHEINDSDAWPGVVVQPVKLTQRWMPKAVFDHAEHISYECVDCHAGDTSELASDVLMPDVYTCGECHASVGSKDKIASACIDCHGFHMEGAGEWPH